MQLPFSTILWPEARSAKLARMYNPVLLTDRKDFMRVILDMYEEDAEFVDPLVAVSGRANVAEQFWALRSLGGDATAVRWSLQAPILQRGTAVVSTSSAAAPLAPVTVSLPLSPSAAASRGTLGLASSATQRLHDQEGLPAGEGSSPSAGPTFGKGAHGKEPPASPSGTDGVHSGAALRVEILATYVLVGLIRIRLR
jgi:hypothetical protein